MKKNLIGFLLKNVARIPPRDFENTIEATLRVLSDYPTQPVDTVFLFGRTASDASSEFFDFVAQLINSGIVKSVTVNGSRGERKGGTIPGESWDGGEIWKERLEERYVENVHFCKPAYDTAIEAEHMFEYAVGQNWTSAVIVAWPHQLVRCFGSVISAMDKSGNFIRCYNACPPHCEWNKIVTGSQGLNPMPRKSHIQLEYSRIHQYMNKGVVPVARMLEYLDARESL